VTPRRVDLVSSNPGKLREIREILGARGYRVRWVRATLPELQAESLAEVVRGKLAALPPSDHPQLVEDSGLFVGSLGGFPGVYSAYAYRTLGLAAILELVGAHPRAAEFRTAAGVRVGGWSRVVEGRCPGTVADGPRGRHGFGYDPIFIPRGSDRTFGELPRREKNRLSHRALAMQRIADLLDRRRGGRSP